MGIEFKHSTYLSLVKKETDLESESEIFNYAKQGLQFKYVDVSVQSFNKKYLANGSMGRKFVALPAAIISGIVKTMYHLAKAVITAHSGGNYLKAQFYYVARDLQESFGWLATLLNDRYGQYHIQESRFHKSCYDCFLANNRQSDRLQGFANTSYPPATTSTSASYPPTTNSTSAPYPQATISSSTDRTVAPSTISLEKIFQNDTHNEQNEYYRKLELSYLDMIFK